MAAVDGSVSLANGSGGDGGHHCQLQWVQQKKTTTISQENYPNDDGAKIDGGRCNALPAEYMIGKQRRQGEGGDNNNSVFPPATKQ
jgi:hypothetical protein